MCIFEKKKNVSVSNSPLKSTFPTKWSTWSSCAHQARTPSWRWACPGAPRTRPTAASSNRCWPRARRHRGSDRLWSCCRAPRTPTYSRCYADVGRNDLHSLEYVFREVLLLWESWAILSKVTVLVQILATPANSGVISLGRSYAQITDGIICDFHVTWRPKKLCDQKKKKNLDRLRRLMGVWSRPGWKRRSTFQVFLLWSGIVWLTVCVWMPTAPTVSSPTPSPARQTAPWRIRGHRAASGRPRGRLSSVRGRESGWRHRPRSLTCRCVKTHEKKKRLFLGSLDVSRNFLSLLGFWLRAEETVGNQR